MFNVYIRFSSYCVIRSIHAYKISNYFFFICQIHVRFMFSYMFRCQPSSCFLFVVMYYFRDTKKTRSGSLMSPELIRCSCLHTNIHSHSNVTITCVDSLLPCGLNCTCLDVESSNNREDGHLYVAIVTGRTVAIGTSFQPVYLFSSPFPLLIVNLLVVFPFHRER
jgi:hypothetical protein